MIELQILKVDQEFFKGEIEMANFSLDDILNLEPSTISRDLSGYITYI